MFALALAVMLASLFGSLHCVGMCGPLAVWATGGGQRRTTIVAYHFGRLTTYWSAGLAAGALGSALTIGGDLAGMQMLAARVAGGLLVVAGILRLARILPRFQRRLDESSPSRAASLLQHAKPLMITRGPHARAYLGGLFTTWLPCGWLYLFVLIAAGAGSVASALTVMTAFWLGTLPALTAVVAGAHSVIPRFRSSIPLIAGVLLIVTGLYTATGRASADLSHMLPPTVPGEVTPTSLVRMTDEPLPCCQESE